MKNIKIKNILFLISLIPYVVLVVNCVKYAIVGYGYNLGELQHGIPAVVDYLNYIFSWALLWIFYPGINIVVGAWIVFQIYYIVSFKKESQKRLKEETNDELEKNESSDQLEGIKKHKTKKIGFKKILFGISVGCWIAYLGVAVLSIFIGANVGGGLFENVKVYGIEAFMGVLVWWGMLFTLIPVLPCSLIYIIMYLVIDKRKKKEECEGQEDCEKREDSEDSEVTDKEVE